jgi:hypothetical protein
MARIVTYVQRYNRQPGGGAIRKLIDLVDGAAWDADERQRSASRTDMVRAIAAAEQREFDQLLARRPEPRSRRPYRRQDKRLRKPRGDEWSAEQLTLLHRRWIAGVLAETIAAELGRSAAAVTGKAQREGLQSRYRPRELLPRLRAE